MTNPISRPTPRSAAQQVLQFGLADRTRQRYDQLFESCPGALIQQSAHWAEAIKDLGPDEPIFLLYSDKGRDVAGMPLYLFRNPLGNILTSIPQAGPMGGVFAKEELTPAQKAEAYRHLLLSARQTAKDNGCIALTLITNPFSPDLELYRSYLAPDLIFENFTQYISLADSGASEFPKGSRANNLRHNLKKAKEADVSLTPCESDADFAAWFQIHQQRHREIGAAPLSADLLWRLHNGLEHRGKSKMFLAKKEKRIIAGGLYVYHERIMDVFMISMDSRYLDSEPAFLVTLGSLRWARAHGITIYNWQSSASRASGVYMFKKQWGALEAPYYFATRLFCEPGRIRSIGLERAKIEYQGHYLVPYDFFKPGMENESHFRKS